LVERRKESEFDYEEYYVTSHFNSVEESLQLFANDDLLCEPGKCRV